MTETKLDKINKKLELLKLQKNKIEQVENTRKRKLLNKQKILMGSYFINKIKIMNKDELLNLKNEIKRTIKETRLKDIEAIEQLFKEFS